MTRATALMLTPSVGFGWSSASGGPASSSVRPRTLVDPSYESNRGSDTSADETNERSFGGSSAAEDDPPVEGSSGDLSVGGRCSAPGLAVMTWPALARKK